MSDERTMRVGRLDVPATLEWTRILLFLLISLGLMSLVAGAIHLTGGLQDSQTLVEGTGITISLVLLSSAGMWSPAIAHVLVRFITGEGFDLGDMLLRPRLDIGWPYWLAGWFLPAVLTLVGAGVFLLLFPDQFRFSAEHIAGLANVQPERIESTTGGTSGFVLSRILVTVLIISLFNSVFAFGEELGWRGYLLPKLLVLGERPAAVLVGVIWGLWHWPIIAMGHNYGLEYVGAPWLGMLAMAWFTVFSGIILAWLTIQSGSVWPATLAHGANNAVFSLGTLFVATEMSPVIGPTTAGIVGSIGWTLFAVWLLLGSPKLSVAIRSAVTRT